MSKQSVVRRLPNFFTELTRFLGHGGVLVNGITHVSKAGDFVEGSSSG
jgi:hypothetical protein